MELRTPKATHKNRNGFTEVKPTPKGEELLDDERMLNREIAQVFLDEMGSYFPSPSKMNDDTFPDQETLASLKERIAELTESHKKNLLKLQSYRVRRLKAEAADRYVAKDEADLYKEMKPGDPRKPVVVPLDAMYKQYEHIWESEFNDIVEHYQYDYLKMMMPLWKRRVELERLEEEARVEREAQFPLTIFAYRGITNKAAQLRVARFLMADATRQEEMRSQSRWAWRQTDPLIQQYTHNPLFQQEIKTLVQELGSTDPRNRGRPPA